MHKAFPPAFLAGSLLLGAATVHAQARFRLGPTVGYNLSSVRFTLPDLPDGVSMMTASRSGVAAGLLAQVDVSARWAVQPAVCYTQQGYGFAKQFHNPATDVTYRQQYASRFDYVSLPVNVVYSQRPAGRGAQVFAGFYVSYLLGGTRTTGTELSGPGMSSEGQVVYRERLFTPANGPFAPRRPDLGVQAGAGYGFAGGWQVQASYSHGVRTAGSVYEAVVTNNSSPPTYRNQAFQVAVAYLWGPKS